MIFGNYSGQSLNAGATKSATAYCAPVNRDAGEAEAPRQPLVAG
jgi:hypothetical protein